MQDGATGPTTFTFPTATAGAPAVSPSGDGHAAASCIEKGWREGVDFFKVESSIVCHDGESIQVGLMMFVIE